MDQSSPNVFARLVRWYGARLARPTTSTARALDAHAVREGRMSREDFLAAWSERWGAWLWLAVPWVLLALIELADRLVVRRVLAVVRRPGQPVPDRP